MDIKILPSVSLHLPLTPRDTDDARASEATPSPAARDEFVGSQSAPQPAPAPLPAPSLGHRVLEEVGEWAANVALLGAKLPGMRQLGYRLYGALTRPKTDTPAIANMGMLAPKLARGAQPTEQGFATLKAKGFDTVVNLRPEEEWEKPLAEKAGLKYVYLPLPAVGEPTNEQALAFLSAVTAPENGEVFFHCQRGIDRTGAMAAAYRIAAQGWTTDEAVAEMRRYGAKVGLAGGFEEGKLDFVNQFAAYWNALPPAQRAAVLHQTSRAAK